MKIKYIQHEVMNDAPFIGGLIVANNCSQNCKGCFNQELKNIESKNLSRYEIIDEVMSNPLNEGIILGGLEWSEQPSDMFELVILALSKELKVMIYTSLSEEDALKMHQFRLIMLSNTMTSKQDIYIKFGYYDENKKVDDNIQFGIKLATSNQKIKHFGGGNE